MIFIVIPNSIFILDFWKPKVVSENKIKFTQGQTFRTTKAGMNVKSLTKGQPLKVYVNTRRQMQMRTG